MTKMTSAAAARIATGKDPGFKARAAAAVERNRGKK